MKKFIAYIINRAKERSTWLGLISLATALGLMLEQEEQDAIIATGMALAGLVGAFTKDKAP